MITLFRPGYRQKLSQAPPGWFISTVIMVFFLHNVSGSAGEMRTTCDDND
jgi:hypothetical protein